MYARNKKMQKLNLNDIANWQPKEYTGKIWITGREFKENEKLKVRVNGQETEMTALEIYEYLH